MPRLRSLKQSIVYLFGTKTRACIASLITIAFLSLIGTAVKNYQYCIGMYHDDSIYLVCAKALAQGMGYKIISLPGEPFETKYPSGLPGVLSWIWFCFPHFPENLPLIEIFQIIIAVASVLVCVLYLIATRRISAFIGLTILAATLLNTHFIDFAPMVMSDLPCALIAALALWQTESKVKSPFSWKLAVWLAFLYATACGFRAQGLVVGASCIVFLTLHRQFRLAGAVSCIYAAFLIPGVIWQKMYQGAAPEYYNFYTNYLAHAYQTLPSSTDWYPAMLANYNWSGILQINTYFPFIARIPYEALPPFMFELIYKLGYLLLGIPLMVGGFTEWRKGRLAALYGFFYAWSLAYWPVKLEWRHILALLAFNYYFYIRGFRFLSRALKPKFRNRGGYRALCNCAMIGFSIYLVTGTVVEAMQRNAIFANSTESNNALANPVTMNGDYMAAIAWIKQNTHDKDVFVCNNDPVLFLYTGRQAVGTSRLEMWRFIFDRLVDAGSLLESIAISRAQYVMCEPTYRSMGYGYEQGKLAIADVQRLHPELLTAVFTSEHGLVQIYAVNEAKLPQDALRRSTY